MMSLQFAATKRVQPGYNTTIGNGRAAWTIFFTGISHPDDFTTHYNYRLVDLAHDDKDDVDVTTDQNGTIVNVQYGKLSPTEVAALRVEQIHVPELWIDWSRT